jgi:hypothetical protein
VSKKEKSKPRSKTTSKGHFELRYRMTADDFSALLYATKQTWSSRVYYNLVPAAYWLLGAFVALPMLFYAPLRQSIMQHAGFYVPPLIVAALGLILFLFHRRVLVPAVIRDALDGQGFLKTECKIVATDSGLTFSCGGITSEIPWRTVERVAESYGRILLFTSRSNGVIAPRHAFATEQEAERFLSFARRRAGKRS